MYLSAGGIVNITYWSGLSQAWAGVRLTRESGCPWLNSGGQWAASYSRSGIGLGLGMNSSLFCGFVLAVALLHKLGNLIYQTIITGIATGSKDVKSFGKRQEGPLLSVASSL